MNSFRCLLLMFVYWPAIVFSQDSSAQRHAFPREESHLPLNKFPEDSTFAILFNISDQFYTANDPKINRFLSKYGYAKPQAIPVGINIELAAVPQNSKMLYSLNASTVVSKQDIAESYFIAGFFRKLIDKSSFWVLAGSGIGTHGSRIVLNGNLPPSFDSLANQYHRLLSLRRRGLLIEPALRLYWYPLQLHKLQLGIFAHAGYDFSFNTPWRLGYFSQNGQFTSFNRIRKSSNVQTVQEYGWVLSNGLSFCFKFD